MIDELRALILDAAPDPDMARAVLACGEDDALDQIMPFSSIIVLGVVVAVEDRYAIRLTKQMLARALTGGVTLRRLAAMIEEVR